MSETYIKFEDSLRAIAGYPGYFWCVASDKLYSIKVGGELRSINLTHPNTFNKLHFSAYRVSVRGVRKFLSKDTILRRLLKEHTIRIPTKVIDPDPEKRDWEYDGEGIRVWKGTRIKYQEEIENNS